jgi:hypothetical protein
MMSCGKRYVPLSDWLYVYICPMIRYSGNEHPEEAASAHGRVASDETSSGEYPGVSVSTRHRQNGYGAFFELPSACKATRQ